MCNADYTILPDNSRLFPQIPVYSPAFLIIFSGFINLYTSCVSHCADVVSLLNLYAQSYCASTDVNTCAERTEQKATKNNATVYLFMLCISTHIFQIFIFNIPIFPE